MYSNSDWDTNFPGTDNKPADLAQQLIYDPQYDLEPATPKLADAIEYQQQQESRYAFILLAADQDIQVAEGLALAFYDQAVDPDEEYVYKVYMNTVDNSLKNMYNYVVTSYSSIEDLPTPKIVEAVGKDLQAEIVFEVAEYENSYSSYDILRRIPGGTFTKVNEMPYYHIITDDRLETSKATYVDDLPSNNTVYEYIIQGRTPFGFLGETSLPIEVLGRPDRLDLSLSLDEATTTESTVTFTWPQLEASAHSQMAGNFTLHRAQLPDAEYFPVGSHLDWYWH